MDSSTSLNFTGSVLVSIPETKIGSSPVMNRVACNALMPTSMRQPPPDKAL